MKKSTNKMKAVTDFVSKKVNTQVTVYRLEKKEWNPIYEASSPEISYRGILEPGHKVCFFFKAPVKWEANLGTGLAARLGDILALKKSETASDSVFAIGGEVTHYELSATVKTYPKKKKKKSDKRVMYRARNFHSFFIYLVDGANEQYKVEIINRDVIPQHKEEEA